MFTGEFTTLVKIVNMTDEIPQIGGRIRQLRRQAKLSQAALARELDISSSYLNLIEHNQRNLTVPLLLKLARRFGIDISDLTANDEAQLTGDLMQVFSAELFDDLDVTNHDIRELANTHPTVARAVVRLHDRLMMAATTAAANDDGSETRLASEQVSDFLQIQGNYFDPLEKVAERVSRDLGPPPLGSEQLMAYLSNVFGVFVRIEPDPDAPPVRFDEARSVLHVSETLPRETRLFAIARCVARHAAEQEVETILEEAQFSQASVSDLATSALQSYVAGAIVLPYSPFLQAAEERKYDVDRLARQFGVSFEQVCHRLTTLQRPGARGVPFHLIRTDIAGNISKRFSISGIRIPRYGGACPRWNVYEAFMQPGRITTQISRMPDGKRFFCIARTLEKGESRYNGAVRHMSIGLGCALPDAQRLVYAQGVELENPSLITEVGVSCRICPRRDCAVRAFPALGEPAEEAEA